MIAFSNILHIIIIFQAIVLCILIQYSNKSKSLSYLLLSSIFAIIAIQIIGLFLFSLGNDFMPWQRLNYIYGFLYGPLLLLYTKSLTVAGYKIRFTDQLHFMPALVILGMLFLDLSPIYKYFTLSYPIHIIFYLAISHRLLRLNHNLKNLKYSGIGFDNFNWLRTIFYIFSIIVIVDVINLSGSFTEYSIFKSSFVENFVYVLILVLINLFYSKGFLSTANLNLLQNTKIPTRRYLSKTNVLSSDLALKEISKIEKYLLMHESWKNPDLSLSSLAKELRISPRNLSKLINLHYHKNFVDFINSYRISRAKERLSQPSDHRETILEVMYEVGFNSKSVFNTLFKKKTGVTPSEYKRSFTKH